ncbi:hypothetical protein P618_200742 [Holospora obtusa F1]|uniref:Uncharacterized protein n=1 Tax=Holospora obtusa F1 TaxID=1399147 RepID=W6TDY5_HOLOB|nr:hypothetical protein [Holospora obtusa]ETZ07061.1 hypothetical protein P618_200742 [Holospora obtusa F1]
MQQIKFLIFSVFLMSTTLSSYAVLSTRVKFAGKEKTFWEKNHANMSETLTWGEFEIEKKKIIESFQKKQKDNPFLECSLKGSDGKERIFIKVPGFQDGSCLWSHLGINPENMMYKVIEPCVNALSDKILKVMTNEQNPNDTKVAGLLGEIYEMLDVLDHSRKFSKIQGNTKNQNKKNKTEDQEKIENLNVIREFDQLVGNRKVIDEWFKGVTETTDDAYRPANGKTFFQTVANYLNMNIKILIINDLDLTLEERESFRFSGTRNWLYLCSNSLGTHYDILIEKDKPVSKAIMEEMYLYLKNSNLYEEEVIVKKVKI